MTQRQIHWLGEFVEQGVILGILYLLLRIVEGQSYRPTFTMPLGVRIAIFVAALALYATWRTYRYYRRHRDEATS